MSRTRRSLRVLLPALALSFATGCLETNQPDLIELVPINCAFTFSFDTTTMTKLESGVFVKDLSVGDGIQVSGGNDVAVYYRGWLTNGTEFDAAVPPNANPFVFTLGGGQVITGFDAGVRGMRVGGCRQVVIPPALGYGNSQVGSIPPNSWLVFVLGLGGAL